MTPTPGRETRLSDALRDLQPPPVVSIQPTDPSLYSPSPTPHPNRPGTRGMVKPL